MWMALESNQPGHPKREGGDPSFKERPEFFTSNEHGYEIQGEWETKNKSPLFIDHYCITVGFPS